MMRALILCLCAATPAMALGQQSNWQGKTVGQWAEQLADDDERAQWYATYALGQIGPEAAAAVEPLVRVLSSRPYEHEYVRCGAAWALGRIAADPETTVPVLAETLKSQLPSIRRTAAEALGRFGRKATSVVPGLVGAMQDPDVTVRVRAAESLWKIGRHARATAALTEIIRQGDAPGAGQAVAALGRLGSENPAALPVLVAALGHADEDVRRTAARALGQIGAAAAVALKPALSDPAAEVRRGAVEAFGWMGPEVVSELIAVLKNDSPAARRAAARALGRLGPAAAKAEPALLKAVDDSDPQVGEAARRARRKVRGGKVTG